MTEEDDDLLNITRKFWSD